MRKAPVARGFFVGDYEGLAAVGKQRLLDHRRSLTR
jgi:hypothetical protein